MKNKISSLQGFLLSRGSILLISLFLSGCFSISGTLGKYFSSLQTAYNLKRDSFKKAKEVSQELSAKRDRLRHMALKAKAEEFIAREAGILPKPYYQEFKPKSSRIDRKECFKNSQELHGEYPREFQATPEPYPSTKAKSKTEAAKPRAVLLDPNLDKYDDVYNTSDVTYISWRRGNRVINVKINGAAELTYDLNEEW